MGLGLGLGLCARGGGCRTFLDPSVSTGDWFQAALQSGASSKVARTSGGERHTVRIRPEFFNLSGSSLHKCFPGVVHNHEPRSSKAFGSPNDEELQLRPQLPQKSRGPPKLPDQLPKEKVDLCDL